MSSFPQPPSHQTFLFDSVTISSDFDSGNCSSAQKIANNHYGIWIGTDHPKNNYRTWFHFSISGIGENTTVTFTLKNMQNQSKLLNEGLVPVWRDEGDTQESGQLKWQRINQKVNTNRIQYLERGIQWSFQHKFETSKKHYFAFFYPWSNLDNQALLKSAEISTKQDSSIYFYRTTIIKSVQGRPVQFLVISSTKGKTNKFQPIKDQFLFTNNQKKPHAFQDNKKIIILSARVHPGEVPGSHVMTGIIKELISDSYTAKTLRDQFVFYIFPILNPDGVARGHYRVDTNGINLNRCYLNPSPKNQPSIYAVKKMILHAHSQDRFFAYLDLHAHATRRGTFIYGNCSNQLIQQMKVCLFPKLLSMNSSDFQYESSNFTQKNMYSKDRGDHISKQGAGRVAIYKATKNPYCWTLQCNYNISRINNILVDKRSPEEALPEQPTQNNLQKKVITEFWQPNQKPATEFFTIQTFHKLGTEICETFLDLVESNKESRIENSRNYFKNVKNVKMYLALALLKMAPNRFESIYKKIFYGITNSENEEIVNHGLKALYYKVVEEANILNINNYIKNGDSSQIDLPKKTVSITKPFRNKQMIKNNVRYRTFLQGKKSNLITNIEQQTSSQNNLEGQKFTIELPSNQNSQEQPRKAQSEQEIEKEGLTAKFESLNVIHHEIRQKYREDLINFQLAHDQYLLDKQQITDRSTHNHKVLVLEKGTTTQTDNTNTQNTSNNITQRNADPLLPCKKESQNESRMSVIRVGEFRMINMTRMGPKLQVKTFAKTKTRLNSQQFRISQAQSTSKDKANETSYTRYRQNKEKNNNQKKIDSNSTNFLVHNMINSRQNQINGQGVFVYGGVSNKVGRVKDGNKMEILKNKKIESFSAL